MKTLKDFLLFSYEIMLFVSALALGLHITDGDFVISLFLLLPFMLVIFVVGNIALFSVLTAMDIIRLKLHPDKKSWFKS